MDLFEFQRRRSKVSSPAAVPAEPVLPESALYVSTSLDLWEPAQADLLARDVTLNGVCFRRLAPDYYAWLRHKLTLAEKALEAGKIAYEVFDSLLVRFNEVHMRAVDKFGRNSLATAMEALDYKRYPPPATAPSMPLGKAKPEQLTPISNLSRKG